MWNSSSPISSGCLGRRGLQGVRCGCLRRPSSRLMRLTVQFSPRSRYGRCTPHAPFRGPASTLATFRSENVPVVGCAIEPPGSGRRLRFARPRFPPICETPLSSKRSDVAPNGCLETCSETWFIIQVATTPREAKMSKLCRQAFTVLLAVTLYAGAMAALSISLSYSASTAPCPNNICR